MGEQALEGSHLENALNERVCVVVAERTDEVGGVRTVLVVVGDVLLLIIAVVVAVAVGHHSPAASLHVVEVRTLDVVVLDADEQSLQQLADLRLSFLPACDIPSFFPLDAVVVISRDVGEQRWKGSQRQVRNLQPGERQQRHDKGEKVTVHCRVAGQPGRQQRLLRYAEVNDRPVGERTKRVSQIVGFVDVVEVILVGKVTAQCA